MHNDDPNEHDQASDTYDDGPTFMVDIADYQGMSVDSDDLETK